MVDPYAVDALFAGVEEADALPINFHDHRRVPGILILVIPGPPKKLVRKCTTKSRACMLFNDLCEKTPTTKAGVFVICSCNVPQGCARFCKRNSSATKAGP